MTVKLYHGTSETTANKLLASNEGLLPRGQSGHEGHWKHTVDSSLETIHLTIAYAGYFAGVASKEDERWAVVEVDVDGENLVPDEDYLEQDTRDILHELAAFYPGFPRTGDMPARTRWFRDHIREFKTLWRESLNGIGNVAHLGPIPEERITRVVFFDPGKNPSMSFMCLDPAISTINYKLLGAQYRALTQWLIGEAVDPEALYHWSWIGMDDEMRQRAIAIVNNVTCLRQIR